MGTKVKGTDVAKWNPVSDYNMVKNAGVNFAILKVINSLNKPDGLFEKHYKGFTDAGIPVIGGYNYSYATTTTKAKSDAKAMLSVADGRIKRFFLDWEDTKLPKDSRAVDIINAYADVILNAGFDFDVYTGLSWYNSYLKEYSAKIPYDFWIARYPSTAAMKLSANPNESKTPVIKNNLSGWQYSSAGSVAGIKGNVDLDYWYQDIIPVQSSSITVIVDKNPYTEPTAVVKLGATGNDANWVLWYLWRFGKLVDSKGQADSTKINGMITSETVVLIKEVQKLLGLEADGKVGPITKAIWKKIC